MACVLYLHQSGDDLVCDDRQGHASRKPLDKAQLSAWAQQYDHLVHNHDDAELLALGLEIAAWLDRDDLWLTGLLQDTTGPICLEIGSASLFDVPWEVLALKTTGHLAEDVVRLFQVQRRVGSPTAPAQPLHGDLTVLFMAAEVEGTSALNYEQEESRFLDATRSLRGQFHLLVEETGSLVGLQARMAGHGGIDVLHLTCHGNIDQQRGPILALESETGALHAVDAGDILAAFGTPLPGLVFLSACRTAEQSPITRAFAQDLVRGGLANVLGWAGSVYDHDAAACAATLYQHLAAGKPITEAVAQGRNALLQAHRATADNGCHWHLLRCYVGPQGGGALRANGQPTRPRPRIDADRAFLDKAAQQVPVASQHHFVGRRRQIQRALRLWQAGDCAGVLIHGLGHMGKSSLAARLVDRLKDRYQPLVLFGRYDAGTLFDKLANALPATERTSFRATWQQAPYQPAVLRDALEEALTGPFSGQGGTLPLLLIVDDLERLLAPKVGQRRSPFATPEAIAIMRAILAAFDAAGLGGSRLLITSRHSFTLPDDQGRDLADRLGEIPLPPLPWVERRKQLLALGGEDVWADDEKRALCQRILTLAAGHPGLQACLLRPLLDLPTAAGVAACETALAALACYCTDGTLPADDPTIGPIFEKLALDSYWGLLTPDERQLAQAISLFDRIVPWSILILTGEAFGVPAAEAALQRLRGLGLVDLYFVGDQTAGMLNDLLRPLLPPLTAEQAKALARRVVRPLYDADRATTGTLPFSRETESLARLALLAEEPVDILSDAATVAGTWLFRGRHDAKAAWELAQATLPLLPTPPDRTLLKFLRLAITCADQLGESSEQDRFLSLAQTVTDGTTNEQALLDVLNADRLLQIGKVVEAETLLRGALTHFQDADDPGSVAVTWGKIADILFQRGDYDAALRIRQQEELPVYGRLGDIRATAITWGKIADILFMRGDYDAALRIRQQEQLPVYGRLGDIRSTAITWGKIADILFQRGDYDEALRIRQQEELPVYRRLGDIRETAIAWGKIADILFQRGEYDEALRIRQQEQLPVYGRLGDIRATAITWGQIADILFRRGDYDEALRIRQQEELPVYGRLGDIRATAIAWGKIADILFRRGEYDEALRIRQQEQLPVYGRLGDIRETAIAWGKIADILFRRGEYDEALRIRQQEQLPVYGRLGDIRETAIAWGKIADILFRRGEYDEALRIRQQEQLPILRKLKDQNGIAASLYGCAMIRWRSQQGLEQDAPVIEQELATSFTINLHLRRADGLKAVAPAYGAILCRRGSVAEARAILQQADEVLAQVNWDRSEIQALLAQLP